MSSEVAKSVADNLATVREKIAGACAEAGRDPSEVTLVAVSKQQPIERVLAAYDAGQRVFGENYVQALAERANALPDDAVWHLVGHLQTNKAKIAAAHVSVVHTVDSLKIGRALSKAGHPLGILIQVNVSGEKTKSGIRPGEVEDLISVLRALDNLQVIGLMAIPEPGAGRRWFASMRELRDALAGSTGLPLEQLSMGMSDDYPDAIVEGATIIRVGTGIFGDRDLRP